MRVFLLVKDFDWFGKTIPKGTKYIQNDNDHYNCYSEGNWIPWLDLTFHTLHSSWSKDYFTEIEPTSKYDLFCEFLKSKEAELDSMKDWEKSILRGKL